MNKKILKTLLLIFSLSLFAISCGGNTSTNPNSDGNNTQQPGDGGDGGNTGNGKVTLKDRDGTYFGGKGIFHVGDGVVTSLTFERDDGQSWSIVDSITLGNADSIETKFFFNQIKIKNSGTTTIVSIELEFIDANSVQITLDGSVGTYKRF